MGDDRWRVLQVLPDLGIGGLPRVVVTLCRALDRSRFDVEVLCLNERGPLARDLQEADIPVHDLAVASQWPDYFKFRRVYGLLRDRGIDVLHTHNTQAFIDGGLAGALARTGTHVHTDHGREFPDKRRLMWAERILSRFAYRVVGVSRDTSHNLILHEKLDHDKVVTIHNGIDGKPFRSASEPAALPAGLERAAGEGVLLGVVARLTPPKGLHFLLRAMPKIKEHVPAARLVIAGYGPLREDLEALARELELEGDVHFLGQRQDLAELYNSFDVFVLPSVSEGLPLVLLEAMAARCPIVATDVGGVKEVLTDGENGLLVFPRDPTALKEAILTLLSDDALRNRIGAAGFRCFRERFSARSMAEKYQALYLAGLDGGSVNPGLSIASGAAG